MTDARKEVDQKNITWILWGGLLFSHIVFTTLVAFKMVPQASGDAAIENALMIFAGMALFSLGISRFFYLKAKAKSVDGSPREEALLFFIQAWGIGESISILGLVYYSTQSTPETAQYAYSFFAAGIGMHLFNKPVFKASGNNPLI
jgi:hypothetical protein